MVQTQMQLYIRTRANVVNFDASAEIVSNLYEYIEHDTSTSTLHSRSIFSYHILGNAGQSMGVQFYQSPSLAPSLANSVFLNLDQLPDYRLKIVIRKLTCK